MSTRPARLHKDATRVARDTAVSRTSRLRLERFNKQQPDPLDRDAAWPTEFFWAGDDPQGGGVRARVEWSDAGQRAVAGRTFRRFSPTFHLDATGRVTGSETNMGGLVNRAAFKRIAPLFASAPGTSAGSDLPATRYSLPATAEVDTPADANRMHTLVTALHSLGLVEAGATEESDLVAQLTRSVGTLKSEISDLRSSLATQARQRAEAHLATAIKAGRIPAKDTDSHAFWTDALLRDEAKAIKALEALPENPALARVVPEGTDTPAGSASLLVRQEQKLAAVRAAHPGADFSTIYAKAKSESPELFISAPAISGTR